VGRKQTAFIPTCLPLRLCEAKAYGDGIMASSSARTAPRWSRVSRICILVVIVQDQRLGIGRRNIDECCGERGLLDLAADAAAE